MNPCLSARPGQQTGGRRRTQAAEGINDSWRFKSRDDDHAAHARLVSATPASSDKASATVKARRSKGSNWGQTQSR